VGRAEFDGGDGGQGFLFGARGDEDTGVLGVEEGGQFETDAGVGAGYYVDLGGELGRVERVVSVE